ncbi:MULTISPECIES: aminotransferase A [Aneurinibacillus]|uniref:Aminotransferase n=1 Tax=Aneurinibacillus thermoaerophilus TaxID=143495 RepID=A0A1G7WRN3_ANETH|nr:MULTISPECIES: aminotransferase A [Aneurinibacillus]AMA73993.1 aromatic amino acid aminotransferase [Aneurinibacillus sp. XH2]MED0676248.1 aminotransferase A [Aneurinibacillus thermoaerophilus]MED0737634.1 aminotransferase A [Aneurinibacillus thermoaerophilus]MED0755626.1 aminotransferase A [Aneurinibacillus thermoaerophilus]MED0760045.1 aminotransferase A [Aneurinibacillus thermoaerophilus]
MEHLINPRVRDIQISGIRKFFNLVQQYDDAISLTIGQPDFATPGHIKEAGKRAIDQNWTTYTPNAGLPELREAAAAFVWKKYGLRYDPVTEIIVTNGASEAIDIALRTVLTEGSEVILPGPVYPGYEPIIRLCGATPVYVDTRETDFKVTTTLLSEKINKNTRCVILPYPSNPTGCTLEQDEIEKIAALLEDKEVFVISDEIYSELIYEKKHRSIASLSSMREKTIVINGLSKSHSMTGWRIGFTFAPAYITSQMVKVHQYNVTCASAISQYAALEALTEGINDAEIMRAEYDKRRTYVYDRLTEMGLDVVKPNGAFYIFPRIGHFGLSSFTFASRLLEEQRVAVVPGDAFSAYGEGYIRISYAYAMEVLEEGLNRLEAFITSLK